MDFCEAKYKILGVKFSRWYIYLVEYYVIYLVEYLVIGLPDYVRCGRVIIYCDGVNRVT